MTSDQKTLAQYVDAWRTSVDDAVALLRNVGDADWTRPTDLAGWDVRCVAAHLAHIESVLAGVEQEPVDVPELAHLTAPTSTWTESGVIARADVPGTEVVDELVAATEKRIAELRADPPTDASAYPPVTPGGVRWSWGTLLSNRIVDVWMHTQDVRRAVDRPGGLDSSGAAHTASVFTRSFGYAVGKRVAPPTGTVVLLDVSGAQPARLAVEVNEDGRAVPTDADASPTVSLRMDFETFVILCGGRRSPDEVDVEVSGEEVLGRQVLAAMAVTP